MTVSACCGRIWQASRTSALGADALQQRSLRLGGRRQTLRAVEHPHPAGRAARLAAADRQMRHAMGAADLQQRRAGRGQHFRPRLVADRQPPPPMRRRRAREREERAPAPSAASATMSRAVAAWRLQRRQFARADRAGSAAAFSRSTSRPATRKPASAAPGTSAARPVSAGRLRRHHASPFSHWCSPMQPCVHTTRSSSDWLRRCARPQQPQFGGITHDRVRLARADAGLEEMRQ